MSKISLRQWGQAIVIIGAALFAIFYTGETGNIADQFIGTNYFFPAGYVFATIWTVIYAGIVAFGVYQLFPKNRDNERIQSASAILTLNMVFNAAWVLVFGEEMFFASLVVIAIMLATSLWFYVRLNLGKVPDASRFERTTWVPLAIYSAWLTIATVANVTIVLIDIGWGGFGIAAPTWGVIMLGVAIALGLGLTMLLREPVFLGVFAYAYIGVAVRYLDSAQNVGIMALVGAAIFGLALLYAVLPVGGKSSLRGALDT